MDLSRPSMPVFVFALKMATYLWTYALTASMVSLSWGWIIRPRYLTDSTMLIPQKDVISVRGTSLALFFRPVTSRQIGFAWVPGAFFGFLYFLPAWVNSSWSSIGIGSVVVPVCFGLGSSSLSSASVCQSSTLLGWSLFLFVIISDFFLLKMRPPGVRA